MAHSETITPHDEGNNPPQYSQNQLSIQTSQAPLIMPQNLLSLTSSASSTYSGYPNQVLNPHLTQVFDPHPVSGPLPNFKHLDQQPRSLHTHPLGPLPNMQPLITPMYQIRQQNPSQVVIQPNVMLAPVPHQRTGPIGEQARPQILQGYLPNQQQPVTIFMQTLPLSSQPTGGYSLPRSENLPEPVNWMSNISIQLEEIPILGTNNSGFFMGERRAQRVDISEQLKFGMRFLDMAIVQYHDEIYLDQYEHIFDLECPYISISEALWSIRFFLERNSREIIFLNLRTTKRVGEKSDDIDADLLEAKFRFIMKFIFDINRVRFNISPGELVDSTKKNIICFTENTEPFNFLYKNSLSFSSNQLELIPFIDYDIEAQLKKSWNRPRKSNTNIPPQNMHFTWFVLDAVTPNSDASLLRSIWGEQFNNGVLPPFHFFSLCKVNKHTWETFNSVMLYKAVN